MATDESLAFTHGGMRENAGPSNFCDIVKDRRIDSMRLRISCYLQDMRPGTSDCVRDGEW